jgi:hypothetical protein
VVPARLLSGMLAVLVISVKAAYMQLCTLGLSADVKSQILPSQSR